jgi:hypothetical protein
VAGVSRATRHRRSPPWRAGAPPPAPKQRQLLKRTDDRSHVLTAGQEAPRRDQWSRRSHHLAPFSIALFYSAVPEPASKCCAPTPFAPSGGKENLPYLPGRGTTRLTGNDSRRDSRPGRARRRRRCAGNCAHLVRASTETGGRGRLRGLRACTPEWARPAFWETGSHHGWTDFRRQTTSPPRTASAPRVSGSRRGAPRAHEPPRQSGGDRLDDRLPLAP